MHLLMNLMNEIYYLVYFIPVTLFSLQYDFKYMPFLILN